MDIAVRAHARNVLPSDHRRCRRLHGMMTAPQDDAAVLLARPARDFSEEMQRSQSGEQLGQKRRVDLLIASGPQIGKRERLLAADQIEVVEQTAMALGEKVVIVEQGLLRGVEEILGAGEVLVWPIVREG